MNSVVICSVKNNILVENGITSTKSPVRDVILVETVRDVICRKNIMYLTARPFAQESVFYQYCIPNRIKPHNEFI